VGGSQKLFPGMTYQFTVTVYDTLSKTSDDYTFKMYAAPEGTSVIDTLIVGETNKQGFIDFSSEMNAWKAEIQNLAYVNRQNLQFTWSIKDASGAALSAAVTSFNSLGIETSILKRYDVYSVEVNVTDGVLFGYTHAYYDADPDFSFEFFATPSSGIALQTEFVLGVSS